MNYELTGGNPKKPMPIMNNYVRNDSGGIRGDERTNPAETYERKDVDGSNGKPYPQMRNFVMGSAMDGYINNQHQPVTPSTTSPDVRLGQVKYAKRAGAESVYKDATRNTADDNAASRKTQRQPSPSSGEWNAGEEGEESQGGSI